MGWGLSWSRHGSAWRGGLGESLCFVPPIPPPGTLAGQCLPLLLARMCQLHWVPPQCLQSLCPPHLHPKTWEEPGGPTHCQTHVLPAMPGWHPTLPRSRPSLPSLPPVPGHTRCQTLPSTALVDAGDVEHGGMGQGVAELGSCWGTSSCISTCRNQGDDALGMQQDKGVMQPCLVPRSTGQHLLPFSHLSHPLWAHVLGRTPLPPAPSIPPCSLFSVSSHFSSR